MQTSHLKNIGKIVKKYFIATVLIIYISGCKTDNYAIDVKKIEQLLFQDVQRVEMIITSSEVKTLNNQEIRILRTCIRNGTELTEIHDKDMPNITTETTNFVIFIITWKDNWSTNLFYDRMNHYMYVYKDQVRFRDKTRYRNLTIEIYNKIMLGVFKFRPSNSIKKLLHP
ncbi:MAG: hypothetical protein K6U03_02040 [Firmicutes bacterium]|nr:hypothetical protein [Bacillota bacterium]